MTAMPMPSDDFDQWSAWRQNLLAELRKMDAKALGDALREAMHVSLKGTVRAAMVALVMDEKGIALTDYLPSAAASALLRIAHGQVLPEIYQQFGGSSIVLRKVAALPLSKQRELANNDPIPVVTTDGEGVTHRLIKPSQLTTEQANQVFASDHVRDQSEQRSYLEQRAARGPRQKESGGIVYDRRRGLVKITEPMELTRKQLCEMLSALEK